MDRLIKMLQAALANNFVWYTETHQNHWDVSGPDFPQYHEFLNRVYSDAQENIDNYGEKLRQMGAYPRIDADGVQSSRTLPAALELPTSEVTDPVEVFTQLSNWNDIMVLQLQDTYDQAGTAREYGIQNFLADRIDAHRQFGWQIHAILGQTP